MIVSSFQAQYGIRLSKDLVGMKWDEFSDLLSGIDENTALGRIVSIRSEKDRDKIAKFTNHERKIYNDWKSRHMKPAAIKDRDQMLANMTEAFLRMDSTLCMGGGE